MQILADLARFLDPIALALVFGGALAAAAFRSTRDDRGRAFAALAAMLRADPDRDGLAALRAVNAIEAVAQARTLGQADRVASADLFLRRAARNLADARSSLAFERWGADEISARRRRHAGAIGFWHAVADAAPAMGMIGTIIGLVGMFSRMTDPATIGPSMALALLTTLYGVILSGAFAGPVAARLERLSEAELDWQQAAVDRLTGIARTELDPPSRLRSVA